MCRGGDGAVVRDVGGEEVWGVEGRLLGGGLGGADGEHGWGVVGVVGVVVMCVCVWWFDTRFFERWRREVGVRVCRFDEVV